MSIKNITSPSSAAEAWEDIVDDLLEIWCSVEVQSRVFLCDSLRASRISADSVKRLSGFSVARLAIVIQEGTETDECWIYDPKLKKIKRFTAF